MKRIILLVFFALSLQCIDAQVIYEKFNSEKLGQERELKIQLPRNYNPEEAIEYPLVIVLDGDYLFEPVIGNTDYQSYWGDIPKCIVVGINQRDTRNNDLLYDQDTYFPAHEGAKFFEFIGMELIPYIESKYLASDFRIAVGHDKSANFINYYLFKNVPVFRAYISISPDLAPEMQNRALAKIPTLQRDTFYYLATGENDIDELKQPIAELNGQMNLVTNPRFHYRFDNFEDADHYSLVGLAIPKALNDIFSFYKPISMEEYRDQVLTFSGTPFEYLEKKYEDIEVFYGFEKKVVENDLRAIAAAAKKNDDVDSLRELSKLASKEYPESMISAWYAGMYHEMDGNIRKALQNYQSGLLLDESEFIVKDMLLDKIYELKD